MLFCLTERGGSHPPVFEILLARETKLILGWWANYSWSSDGAPHFVKPHPTMLSMICIPKSKIRRISLVWRVIPGKWSGFSIKKFRSRGVCMWPQSARNMDIWDNRMSLYSKLPCLRKIDHYLIPLRFSGSGRFFHLSITVRFTRLGITSKSMSTSTAGELSGYDCLHGLTRMASQAG